MYTLIVRNGGTNVCLSFLPCLLRLHSIFCTLTLPLASCSSEFETVILICANSYNLCYMPPKHTCHGRGLFSTSKCHGRGLSSLLPNAMCSKSFTVATAEYLRLGNVPRTALNSGKPKIEGLMSGMVEDIMWRERKNIRA